MASERAAQLAVVAGAALLALAGSAAAASPAGAAAMAFAAVAFVWRGLAMLAALGKTAPLEVPVGVPRDQAALAARVLELESQLEFAPIALFRLDGVAAPLNASARRLCAPGRAADAGALQSTLAALADGQRSVIDFDSERGTERALATAISLTVEGRAQRLVAVMPVETELEAEAMQAWQKLVHVLTHEIMNSLTPVASLSHTARAMVAGVRTDLPDDIASDLDTALDAIGRRADSLTHFVRGYRSMASVPDAVVQRIVIAELFARLAALVAPAWQARGGSAMFAVDSDSLELLADAGQLEQALVNLLVNAAEATASVATPQVTVTARLVRGSRLRIEVCDNGPGVPGELIAHIFTPFFSTKSQGGGIGLAMVRQLIHRNGGALRYAKSLGPGARFIVTF